MTAPRRSRDLHRRASRWYEQNGEPSPAVRHALAAGDVERAAGLVELAIPALRRSRQEATIRGWLDALPDEVVRVRPVLAVGLVGALMQGGEFEGVEGRLRDVEQCLDNRSAHGEGSQAASAGTVVLDEEELRRLPGTIQMYRAALALVRGDVPATIRHAQLASAARPTTTTSPGPGHRPCPGSRCWGDGDLEAAHAAYSASAEGMLRAGHLSDVLGCSITLADIRITQGRLGEALRTYEHALRVAAPDAGTVLRGTADMYVGMSQIACERNDLDAATAYLLRSRELGEHTGLPQNAYRWRVAMARIREAQGDAGGALALLDEAQRVYTGDFSPNVRPVPALHARVLAAHGQVGEALRWARDRGLSVDDDLSYLREYEHVTLARVLLAQYTANRSDGSLRRGDPAPAAPPAGRGGGKARTGSVIEILVLQALTTRPR